MARSAISKFGRQASRGSSSSSGRGSSSSSITTSFATTTATRSLLSIGMPWDGRDKLNAGREDRK